MKVKMRSREKLINAIKLSLLVDDVTTFADKFNADSEQHFSVSNFFSNISIFTF